VCEVRVLLDVVLCDLVDGGLNKINAPELLCALGTCKVAPVFI
jgi:hypothetical protein